MAKLLDCYFENYSVAPITGGATDADLFQITIGENQNYILKKQPSSLESDYLNYKWLEGKIAVPEVVFYCQFNQNEWLCMSALQGHTLDYYIGQIEEKEIVRRYATALKSLHSLNIDRCALIQDLDKKVARARYNMENGLVDISELQPDNQSCNMNELFEKLISIQPTDFELVFTHGDYCFDNIIYNKDQFSGFIDIGNGGVADKYQDIALAVRSIHDNFCSELADVFYKEYGLSKIDNSKLEFYALLDEFF